MRNWLPIGLQLALMTIPSNAIYGQSERPFSAPDSVILSSWQDRDLLLLTTPSGNFPIQGPPGFKDSGYFVLPALAPAGDRIAAGLTLPDDSERTKCDPSLVTCALPGPAQHKSVMGVYSVRDGSWKLYGDFCSPLEGPPAFSPDGAKIAFKAVMRTVYSGCDTGYGVNALLILDLAGGQFFQVPNTAMVVSNARISWSPDGKYLAVQTYPEEGERIPGRIVLIEVGSWTQKIIAMGAAPAWSPNGDWIAYLSGSYQERCMLIHPDGTGAKVVRDENRRRTLWQWGIDDQVWSPDGKTLILRESGGFLSDKTDEVSVDLATDKVKMLPRNSVTVYGWARLTSNQLPGAGK